VIGQVPGEGRHGGKAMREQMLEGARQRGGASGTDPGFTPTLLGYIPRRVHGPVLRRRLDAVPVRGGACSGARSAARGSISTGEVCPRTRTAVDLGRRRSGTLCARSSADCRRADRADLVLCDTLYAWCSRPAGSAVSSGDVARAAWRGRQQLGAQCSELDDDPASKCACGRGARLACGSFGGRGAGWSIASHSAEARMIRCGPRAWGRTMSMITVKEDSCARHPSPFPMSPWSHQLAQTHP